MTANGVHCGMELRARPSEQSQATGRKGAMCRHAVGAAWFVFICLLFATGTRPVLAENCERGMPSEVRFARGYTFVATLIAMRGETPESRPPSWDFAVDRVFAGEDRPVTSPVYHAIKPGATTTFDGRCYPPRHLRIGQRYLISKGDLVTFASMSTVAWELDANDRVHLVRQYGSHNLDPRIAGPTTLAEAVALMAPNTVLPPTDAAKIGSPDGDAAPLLLTATFVIGALGWVRRGSPERRSPTGSRPPAPERERVCAQTTDLLSP